MKQGKNRRKIKKQECPQTTYEINVSLVKRTNTLCTIITKENIRKLLTYSKAIDS